MAFANYKDLSYIAGTPAETNGPLQTWLEGGNYEVPFEFFNEVSASLLPAVAFQGWRIDVVDSNIVNIPRLAHVGAESGTEILESYNIGERGNPQRLTGKYDNVELKNVLRLMIFFERWEVATVKGVDIIGWSLQDAAYILAMQYERKAFFEIADKGKDLSTLTLHDGTPVTAGTVYHTILNINAYAAEVGIAAQNLVIFINPKTYTQLMKDGVIIANGQSEIQSTEVRVGFKGTIDGTPIVVVPRLGNFVSQSSLAPQITSSHHTDNIGFMDMTAVREFRNIAVPLTLEKAPSDYYDGIIMKSLEYFGFYVKNPNQVAFGVVGASVTPAE